MTIALFICFFFFFILNSYISSFFNKNIIKIFFLSLSFSFFFIDCKFFCYLFFFLDIIIFLLYCNLLNDYQNSLISESIILTLYLNNIVYKTLIRYIFLSIFFLLYLLNLDELPLFFVIVFFCCVKIFLVYSSITNYTKGWIFFFNLSFCFFFVLFIFFLTIYINYLLDKTFFITDINNFEFKFFLLVFIIVCFIFMIFNINTLVSHNLGGFGYVRLIFLFYIFLLSLNNFLIIFFIIFITYFFSFLKAIFLKNVYDYENPILHMFISWDLIEKIFLIIPSICNYFVKYFLNNTNKILNITKDEFLLDSSWLCDEKTFLYDRDADVNKKVILYYNLVSFVIYFFLLIFMDKCFFLTCFIVFFTGFIILINFNNFKYFQNKLLLVNYFFIVILFI